MPPSCVENISINNENNGRTFFTSRVIWLCGAWRIYSSIAKMTHTPNMIRRGIDHNIHHWYNECLLFLCRVGISPYSLFLLRNQKISRKRTTASPHRRLRKRINGHASRRQAGKYMPLWGAKNKFINNKDNGHNLLKGEHFNVAQYLMLRLPL